MYKVIHWRTDCNSKTLKITQVSINIRLAKLNYVLCTWWLGAWVLADHVLNKGDQDKEDNEGVNSILDMLSSRNSVQEAARWDGTYGRKTMFTHSHKYVYASISGPRAHVIFHDKRDLADVIKLRILRRRDYPGRLNVIKRVLWREKQVVGNGVSQSGEEVCGWKQRSEWLAPSRTVSPSWKVKEQIPSHYLQKKCSSATTLISIP